MHNVKFQVILSTPNLFVIKDIGKTASVTNFIDEIIDFCSTIGYNKKQDFVYFDSCGTPTTVILHECGFSFGILKEGQYQTIIQNADPKGPFYEVQI